ncbi:MAG: SIS domain-containing protein [Prolixibacteraceae bacterium]|nr:SIS domain-containing protein [Prolixibacteraceae bacterium]
MLQVILDDLIKRYPALEPLKDKISDAGQSLISCYENKGKVLVCGNGGSCSDSDHIVGELMKGFEHKRPVDEKFRNKLFEVGGERGQFLSEKLQVGLPAISLTAHNALITAVANDTDANLIFAQQVVGYGNSGDILIAISSSGNSQNVLDAILVAKAKGLKVIGLTGESGGKMNGLCDVLINVPGKRTASVQEYHLPVYHALCVMVESHFFGNFYLDSK